MSGNPTRTPIRVFNPMNASDVQLLPGFWQERLAVVRDHTLPHIYARLNAVGAIDGLRLKWRPGQANRPKLAADTDIYKWLEAASYVLRQSPSDRLQELVDGLIAIVSAAQQPDGYLNPYYTVVEPNGRWNNLRDAHELYSAGHLIEAGVAHAQSTGDERLLKVGIRFADLVAKTFGHGPGQIRGYCGHPEIELALLRLYRHTAENRYLELAKYFIDERGTEPYYFAIEAAERRAIGFSSVFKQNIGVEERRYNQSHAPIRQHTEVVGHAVRAMYLYTAATELASEIGDEELMSTCERLWESMVEKRMYITGAVGSSKSNEGFTTDYDLPDSTAYGETCAAIGVVFWAHRMSMARGASFHVDVLERALYNGALTGLSLDGGAFFYENPLASAGGITRKPWYDIACCPSNIARLIASVGGYAYARVGRDLILNLYLSSRLKFEVGGRCVELRQRSELPWSGGTDIVFESDPNQEFAVHLRIPRWARSRAITVNGAEVTGEIDRSGYVVVERTWRRGDSISIDFPVEPKAIPGNPLVESQVRRIALSRGPLVYCFEQFDQKHLDRSIDPSEMVIDPGSDLHDGEPFDDAGDAIVVQTPAMVSSTESARAEMTAKAVPYHLWANRDIGAMRVWMAAASDGGVVREAP